MQLQYVIIKANGILFSAGTFYIVSELDLAKFQSLELFDVVTNSTFRNGLNISRSSCKRYLDCALAIIRVQLFLFLQLFFRAFTVVSGLCRNRRETKQVIINLFYFMPSLFFNDCFFSRNFLLQFNQSRLLDV